MHPFKMLNTSIPKFQKPEEPRTQSSREPRRQSQESGEENLLVRKQEARVAVTERRLSSNQTPRLSTAQTNQRTGVEAEILRNINLEEPEIIDSLRPQPSILSTVIDGNIHTVPATFIYLFYHFWTIDI